MIWAIRLVALCMVLGGWSFQALAESDRIGFGQRGLSVLDNEELAEYLLYRLPDTGAVRRAFSLVGDPGFQRSDLNPEARIWYDRFWAAVEREQTGDNPKYDATSHARSDNTYNYGRQLNQYMTMLLAALRATGDLSILDEVDRLAQLMRAELGDYWCDGSNFSDGFLNWRVRRRTCTDDDTLEESLAHGNVAAFAYAFHVNRDKPSPAGVDYAERADFWLDYLKNHFEEKWRQGTGGRRASGAWPNFPIAYKNHTHPEMHELRFYYYMWKMTGLTPYRDWAQRRMDLWLDTQRVMGEEPGGFMAVPASYGDPSLSGEAFVYTHRNPNERWREGNCAFTTEYGQKATYMRYNIAGIVDLHMEGFYRWDQSFVEKHGNGVAAFLIDEKSPGSFGPGPNGEVVIEHDGWTMEANCNGRLSRDRFHTSTYGLPLAFMQAGPARTKLNDMLMTVYDMEERDPDRPRSIFTPVTMLLAVVH